MGKLGWIGSGVALAATVFLAILFIGKLVLRWPSLSVQQRVLLSVMLAEFVLGTSLLAIELFVTDASWTWLAFIVLVIAPVATERQWKRSQRPPAASR